jgi:hypothetical protein
MFGWLPWGNLLLVVALTFLFGKILQAGLSAQGSAAAPHATLPSDSVDEHP